MLSVVCWKWGTKYTGLHVNRLAASVGRNLKVPYKFFCLTDNASGLDAGIQALPLWPDWPSKELPYAKPDYRQRVRIYSPAIEEVLGRRIMQIDLDTVVTRNITKLASREEPFVVWYSSPSPSSWAYEFHYNPSLVLLDAGEPRGLWKAFEADPGALCNGHVEACVASRRLDLSGSKKVGDQGVLCHWLGTTSTRVATFGRKDGIYQIRHLMNRNELPPDARMVMFDSSGDPNCDPSRYADHCAWVRRHWGPPLPRQARRMAVPWQAPVTASVTAVLQTWRRPSSNIRQVVAELQRSPLVGEILLWNNNTKHPLQIAGVHVLNAQVETGIMARYALAVLAKHRTLWFQDDDLLLTAEQLSMIHNAYLADTSMAYGVSGRILGADLSYSTANMYGRCDLLARAHMVSWTRLSRMYALLPTVHKKPHGQDDGEDDIYALMGAGRATCFALDVGVVVNLPGAVEARTARYKRPDHLKRRNEAVSDVIAKLAVA